MRFYTRTEWGISVASNLSYAMFVNTAIITFLVTATA